MEVVGVVVVEEAVGMEEDEETRIYGEPCWAHKDKSWEALRSLHGRMDKPWIILGYFNKILSHHEKR
jgi:hypothetical protein